MSSYPPPPPPGGDQPPQHQQEGGWSYPPEQQGGYPPPGQQGHPPPGQQGYPPPAYYQQPPRQGSGMAVTALVLGVIALLSCWTVVGGILFGLVAIVLGIVAARRARRGEAGGRGMAITGTVLGLLGVVLAAAVVALLGAFWNSASFEDYRDCVRDAGADQTALEECEREFQDVIVEEPG